MCTTVVPILFPDLWGCGHQNCVLHTYSIKSMLCAPVYILVCERINPPKKSEFMHVSFMSEGSAVQQRNFICGGELLDDTSAVNF